MYFKYLGFLFGLFMAFYHFFLSHFFPTLIDMIYRFILKIPPFRDAGPEAPPENERGG